ncbi:MAG TPA: FAD-dependent oxidoreductase [Ktedonobacteraceae bacterium]|nr:FAD-dependent oxidoreductase [Ktedonobacteraceae bacterium]
MSAVAPGPGSERVPTYVIVGNGIAGVTAAEILRAEDAVAHITVIADDPFPVYYRPALKDYLAGRVREDRLWARPSSFYQDARVRFLPERVVGIRTEQHVLQLQSGRHIGYGKLLLANGARASCLNCPGVQLTGVTTLRTVADYQAVLRRLSVVRRVVVSGSGTLALESIETLRHRGYEVTHLLRRRTLWSEILDPVASDLVLQQERRDGVDVRLEEEIVEITGKDGQVCGVVTSRGEPIPCEMVLIAIGIDPLIDFIRQSGIACARGVQVDEAMRTSAPDVYAAGDVLEVRDPASGRARVLGQWYPAIQQARAAAYSMLGLLDSEQHFSPAHFYNATFLYGLDFASVGVTQMPKDGALAGFQEIVAEPQPRSYRKVILKNGVAVGYLALGNRKDALAFKRAIDHGVNLAPVAGQLFDDDFQLSAWLDRQHVPPPLLNVRRAGDAAVRQAAYKQGETQFIRPETIGLKAVAVTQRKLRTEAVLVPVSSTQSGAGLATLPEKRLSQTRVITIGRQPGVALYIDHASVSRRHAEISYANGQYILRDLGSTNGTYVNDARLEAERTVALAQNDLVRFGKLIEFIFKVRTTSASISNPISQPGIATAEEMETGAMPALSAHLSAQPAPILGQPVLQKDGSLLLPGAVTPLAPAAVAALYGSPALVIVAQGRPQVYPLREKQHLVLGRERSCDIVLADITISRTHAEIFSGPDGFYVHDLQSSNGVVVNSARIDEPYRLSHGDRVSFGSIQGYFIDLQSGTEIPEETREARQGKLPLPAETIPVESLLACPHCGTLNTRSARFCAGCARKLKL